jgi:hypothetical protein
MTAAAMAANLRIIEIPPVQKGANKIEPYPDAENDDACLSAP